jgi:hypothetical protein
MNIKPRFFEDSPISTDDIDTAIKYIYRNECFSFVGFYASGLSTLGQLIYPRLSKYTNKFYNDYLKDIKFIYLDLDLDSASLNSIINVNLGADSDKDPINTIFKFVQPEGKIYFIIDNLSSKNIQAKISLIKELASISKLNIRFIFLLGYIQYHNLKSTLDFQFYWQNIIQCKYLNDNDAMLWLNLVIQKLKIEDITQETKNKIINFSGGIPGVIKNYLRTYVNIDTKNQLVEENEQFKDYLHSYYDNVTQDFKSEFIDLIINHKTSQTAFYEFNMANKDGLRGQWYKYIELFPIVKSIEKSNSNFLINGIKLNDLFNDREQDLLVILFANLNTIVTRDQIAKIIWPLNISDHYSEYVIDQTISRLRKKLLKLKILPLQITTHKKLGFVLH